MRMSIKEPLNLLMKSQMHCRIPTWIAGFAGKVFVGLATLGIIFNAWGDNLKLTPVWSLYYGGERSDWFSDEDGNPKGGVTVDSAGNLYFAGDTDSPWLPPNSWPPSGTAGWNGFVAKAPPQPGAWWLIFMDDVVQERRG